MQSTSSKKNLKKGRRLEVSSGGRKGGRGVSKTTLSGRRFGVESGNSKPSADEGRRDSEVKKEGGRRGTIRRGRGNAIEGKKPGGNFLEVRD